MNIRYTNQQDDSDSLNGTMIVGREKLVELLDDARKRAPFVAELSADNGFQLTFGIGGDLGFAQYSRADGALPYLVAVPAQPRIGARYVNFSMNNTPTPIPGNFVLSFDEMKEIATYFLETGQRSAAFAWKSI